MDTKDEDSEMDHGQPEASNPQPESRERSRVHRLSDSDALPGGALGQESPTERDPQLPLGRGLDHLDLTQVPSQVVSVPWPPKIVPLTVEI